METSSYPKPMVDASVFKLVLQVLQRNPAIGYPHRDIPSGPSACSLFSTATSFYAALFKFCDSQAAQYYFLCNLTISPNPSLSSYLGYFA
jgi:hypothetical protein